MDSSRDGGGEGLTDYTDLAAEANFAARHWKLRISNWILNDLYIFVLIQGFVTVYEILSQN